MLDLDNCEEVLRSGHAACPGCGVAMGMRLVLLALGHRAVVVVVPSCIGIIAGPYPYTSLGVPAFHAALETAAPSAAGIAAAFQATGQEDIPVLAFAGDGGTFDIGLQSLSGAVHRNDNFIYVCLDNEGYMNTGIQVSSATPFGAWTATSPTGNTKRKKQIMEIMAAHSIPYAATASIGFPEDLMRKVQKAKNIKGSKFIHLLSPCNTGWKIPTHLAPKIAALSVETSVFPLYEIEGGRRYIINHQPLRLPVEKYLALQGRFQNLTADQIAASQREADCQWEILSAKASP